ncbi:TetR family transcriptional regulator [Prauserella shujinwangii]|uniref:TetR family transcriptional regulator n=1 Tax=Prauserella shujinwangii TaxID=1453103 RepID=A0A2T0LU10_9PSEU|nr:TetR/AcrR family transcriptional regulator [Prauserella shujinwangii]PRX47221.1 TetR family transcriptional regulator [Prauserella shujinwangii]
MTESVNRHHDGRAERWRAHRLARRAEFVDAAFRAFDRLGPGAGMADIAREAGVAKPRLYRHFADRAALVAAVSERLSALVWEHLGPALREPAPMRVRVRESLRAYFAVVDEHPNVVRLVCRARSTDVVAGDRGAAAGAIASMFGEYLKVFGVTSAGTEPWAHGVVGAVEAASDWWLEHPAMTRDEIVDYLTTLVGGAIEAALRSEGVDLDPDEPLDLTGKERHGNRS